MNEAPETKWACQLRSLLGGIEDNPLGLDGAVAAYETILRSSNAYVVFCLKLPEQFLPGHAQLLVANLSSCMDEDAQKAVHYETTMDETGTAILLLESEDPHLLRESKTRALASGITVFMERETGAELRIGIGSLCKSPVYLPFSKADALRNMTRYNVSKTIESVITYISINYSDPELSVGQIAKDNFLNYSYLCTQFRREVGVSPGRFIQQFRMRTAADLLSLPNRTVLEVARTVGYCDVKYFSKCFKAAYHATPNQYRTFRCAQREKLMGKFENIVEKREKSEYNTKP